MKEPAIASHNEDRLLTTLAGTHAGKNIRTLYVIGAHKFQERELFHELFPRLENIYLFEPIPGLFKQLVRNTADDPRIRVFPYAIADADGQATFHVTNNAASSSLMPLGKHREVFPHVVESAQIRVECRKLETVIREERLSAPDMLFIDVQGAEYKVLSAIGPALLSRVAIIYTEASTEEIYVGGRPLADIQELLRNDFDFRGFAPLEPHTPTHGNALFLNRSVDTTEADLPDTEETPRVSAIVSTYKSAAFLPGCLDDLIAQTLYAQSKLEIVVIDSGSPENEGQIVAEYQTRHPHIRYIRTEERETIYAAWNRGIRAARGKYITNANTDDRHRADALEVMAAELDAHPETALVYSDVFVTNLPHETFDRHIRCGYHVRPEFAPEIMLSGCHMSPQPMWRRSVHDEVGWFDGEFRSAGDYEFWCRIAQRYPLRHIRQFLGLYYENPGGICNANTGLGARETARVKKMYRTEFPPPRPPYGANYQHLLPVRPGGYVNIGMVTYNRLEFTRRALHAFVGYTRFPHVLTVIDNGSTDGTREYLEEMRSRGIIRNLVLLTENVGVAKASNLAWSLEPEADYYLKLDNDIVIRKGGWLEAMVAVIDVIPDLGAVAYNFEPKSYPLSSENGHEIRIKGSGNLGGACILIPRRTHEILGWWCEDYGLYSEEDADYGFRIRCAGLRNAYMADEEIGDHLPAGKAAVINPLTMEAADGIEEHEQAEYRRWKDEQRRRNVGPDGILTGNARLYRSGRKPLYVESGFVANRQAEKYPEHQGESSMTLKIDDRPGTTANEPLVTAIVSSYNAERFMRECLTDLENQTIADRLEIIVVDAASPQAEGAVVADFQRRHNNITYVRTGTRIGVYAAWNLALRLARGKYVTPFSTNDRLRKDAYEIMVRALESRPDVGLVYGDSFITNTPHETFENHTRVGMFNWPPYSLELLLDNCMVGPHPMWRRSVHDVIGGFDESYIALGDQDFFIRVGKNFPLLHINDVTGLYWMSDDGLSNQQAISSPELIKLRQEHPRLTTPPPRVQPAPAVSREKEEAARLKQEQRYGEAADLYRRLLNAGDRTILAELGDCLANIGKLDEAAEAYQQALRSQGDDIAALVGLGVLGILSGDASAASFFERAVAIDSSNTRALSGLGMAYIAAGKSREAFLTFEKCLQIDPEDLTALGELVKTAYLTGRFTDAARRVEKYLHYHPADLDMLFALAGLQYKAGENAAAVDNVEKILLFAPDYPGAGELMTKLAEEASAPEDDETTCSTDAEKGRSCKAEGDFREALGYFTAALVAGDRSVLADIGDCHARLGDCCQAEEAYRQVLVEGGSPAKALTGLGVLALVDGRPEDALKQFEKAVAAAPGDVSALCGKGMALTLIGKLDEAFATFCTVLQNDPVNLQALHEMVKIAYQLQAHREAEKHLQRYLMHHPADLDMLFTVAGLQFAGGRLREAMESVEKVLLFAPDYEGAEELRGMIAAA